MKNTIAPILGLLLICWSCSSDKKTDSGDVNLDEKEYNHDQETRNLRNPENMPGLDYTGADSLEDYQEENLNIQNMLSNDFRKKLNENENFKNKQIERVDSVQNGSEYKFRINFRGDPKSYSFDRYGNLISG